VTQSRNFRYWCGTTKYKAKIKTTGTEIELEKSRIQNLSIYKTLEIDDESCEKIVSPKAN